jgi:hypothetical protein
MTGQGGETGQIPCIGRIYSKNRQQMQARSENDPDRNDPTEKKVHENHGHKRD